MRILGILRWDALQSVMPTNKRNLPHKHTFHRLGKVPFKRIKAPVNSTHKNPIIHLQGFILKILSTTIQTFVFVMIAIVVGIFVSSIPSSPISQRKLCIRKTI